MRGLFHQQAEQVGDDADVELGFAVLARPERGWALAQAQAARMRGDDVDQDLEADGR